MNDSFSSIADRIDQAQVLDAGEAFDGGVPPVSSLSRELVLKCPDELRRIFADLKAKGKA